MKNIKYGFLCFVPSLILLLSWNRLPDQIATHFNFYGNADSLSGRWSVILLVPTLGFIGHVIYMYVLDRKPEWIGRTGFHKYSFLYFPILVCFVIVLMLWNC